MINNINDGQINYNLPFLNEKADEYSRFSVDKGNLVLTKNGSPFKVAIHDTTTKDMIIANGNLYIIKVDTKIYHPIFLKAYLMSKHGQQAINELAKGTTIKNISIKDLNHVKVPNISMEKQEEFARLFEQYNKEISKAMQKISDIKQEKTDLLNKFLD